MVDTDARIAWQLFHVNWLPIAAMGSLLALAVVFTDFALEPMAYGATIAVALGFVLMAYRHRLSKAELADPKLVFSLGAIGQGRVAGLADLPPLLGHGLGREPGHVAGEISARVLEITEEVEAAIGQPAAEDGVVPDAGGGEVAQHLGPDRGVEALVLRSPLGLQFDDTAVAGGIHGAGRNLAIPG